MAFVSVFCRGEAVPGASPILGKVWGGAAPRSLRGKISKTRVNKEADGERERKGMVFDFSDFPKRMKGGIRCLRG